MNPVKMQIYAQVYGSIYFHMEKGIAQAARNQVTNEVHAKVWDAAWFEINSELHNCFPAS